MYFRSEVNGDSEVFVVNYFFNLVVFDNSSTEKILCLFDVNPIQGRLFWSSGGQGGGGGGHKVPP